MTARRIVGAFAGVALLMIALVGAPSASATTLPGPGFAIESLAVPTVFSVEHTSKAPDTYMLAAVNTGSTSTDGTPIVVKDVLPPAVRATAVVGEVESSGVSLSCGSPEVEVVCTYSGVLKSGESLRILVTVAVIAGTSEEITNTAMVSGGGALTVITSERTRAGSEQESLAVQFGLQSLGVSVVGPDGSKDSQAGEHPYENTVSFAFNTVPNVANGTYPDAGIAGRAASPKDFVADLPQGLLGDPAAVERCPQYKVPLNECPPASQVGVVKVVLIPTVGERFHDEVLPVYNVVPTTGFPAQFEFTVLGKFPVVLYATLNPNDNYAVRVTVADIPAVGHVSSSRVTFFGTPDSDPNYLNRAHGSGAAATAFLENPTGCTDEPQQALLFTDAWQTPGATLEDGTPDLSDPNWLVFPTTIFSNVSGCEKLQFHPSIELTPQTTRADEPTGVAVDINEPQAPLESADLGSPAMKAATVTLPSGLSISPSAADGLEGCAGAQIALLSSAPGHCPLKSKIATVRVTTPLLSEQLEGSVFLEDPNCDPCSNADATDGNMFRMFLEVAGSGVVIKKEGVVYANTTTGQLTTTFADIPQAPISHIELRFNSGLRAALATPQSCGTFTTTSDLTPWSTPATPDSTPLSSFDVDWDGAGGACPSTLPFAPSFEAGTSNPDAGQFSPLTVSFHREDREQDIAGVQVTTPPGLLGSLSGIPLCGEPQADLGTCSVASQIGSMNVAAGPGGHPFYQHGEIYLTGPYKSAPFGLSIVVPTVAGPFHLGNVVVRAQIDIDPNSGALTVTSDPVPQIIDGVPLRLRLANVTVDRPNFTFNPTNCELHHIQATITGTQGAIAHEGVPFAVSGCAGLHFAPSFKAFDDGENLQGKGGEPRHTADGSKWAAVKHRESHR